MTLQKQIQEEKGMSSIRISHKAKSKLTKIGAKLTLKDGKIHSMEEIIDILMEQYEKDHKE
jgi:ABC-type thiamine transport system ATPase subunit